MRIGVSLPAREVGDDLGLLRAFAREAESLGFTHLRVPDLVLRPGGSSLHEPMMLLAWVAAVTERIELVPSVIVSPSRQTVLLAKQAAELSLLSGGRCRLGVGVGRSREEFEAMGMGDEFGVRGARLEEQIELMRCLWGEDAPSFAGRWDRLPAGMGLAPRPAHPVPIWVGAGRELSPRIAQRIGRLADGWFVLSDPERFAEDWAVIDTARADAARPEGSVGAEAAVAVVGDGADGWTDRAREWRAAGLSHLCLRTLGAGLVAQEHLVALRSAARDLAELNEE